MRRQIHALDPGVLWSIVLVLALVTALMVGAMVLQRARRDLLGEEEAPEDVGGSLRDAFEAGELTEEEYLKVRESLGDVDHGPKPPNVPRF